ncbi:MAG: Gfo/Idh/MocA family oxidoreductase [Chloroflexi bacterium]|nr:Gfo/Idh/MocA family oxidoreductase [Chloroflexota bacterium]
MSAIRIAVIGAGLLGTRHARVFHEQPDAELVAVADVNPAREEIASRFGAAFYPDITTLLANETIDAVAVATPDQSHRQPVLAALGAGKHVFVEKPLATSVEDTQAITAAAAQVGTICMVNYSQRFVTDYAWIKQACDNGLIGAARMIISVKFDQISVPTGMIRGWAGQTSPIFFMSSHDIDLTGWYIGAEPVEVVAHESRGTLDTLGIPVHDGIMVLVRYANGANANFHSSWIHPNSYPNVADGYMQVIGESGAILYRNGGRIIELHNAHGGQRIEFSGAHTANEIGGKLTGAFTASVRQFLDSVRTGTEPMLSVRRTLATSRIQLAAIESIATGKSVAI